MWRTVVFRFRRDGKDIEAARTRRDKWIARHQAHYQIVEIFVNNAFALDVRKLRKA